ncbi:Gfo/Idh/MocA family oxidoreductase [Lentilitoribacter sp. Alg239-R112]|uniref:Gfo/Idh/MocA family protein n=1 Tax=Lentilitoribacter sp. Alg239-R112 TaxID=2305987 RepID=UPI0013A6AEA7|nr:Gfo/Idh/MocA family oxidoreductase [Lentilitoribacter sp. Alg239-R112]
MAAKLYNIAIVGVGEIARNQHIPAILKNGDFKFCAAVSRHQKADGVPNFISLSDMLESDTNVDAVSLCVPPQVRFDMACEALLAKKHVLLEKPPGISVVEVERLIDLANRQGVSLFATWHSRYAAAVETAKQWLSDKRIKSVKIIWKEDVKHWHPGQKWIWQAGGMGVFDPGINALSILTYIMNVPFHLQKAELKFPQNCETPIAADMAFTGENRLEIEAEFDWRQEGAQQWDIYVQTDAGNMHLAEGGSQMLIDGALHFEAPEAEYPNIYARLSDLLNSNQSDVDIMPLKHVADAFMLGKRTIVEQFHDDRSGH